MKLYCYYITESLTIDQTGLYCYVILQELNPPYLPDEYKSSLGILYACTYKKNYAKKFEETHNMKIFKKCVYQVDKENKKEIFDYIDKGIFEKAELDYHPYTTYLIDEDNLYQGGNTIIILSTNIEYSTIIQSADDIIINLLTSYSMMSVVINNENPMYYLNKDYRKLLKHFHYKDFIYGLSDAYENESYCDNVGVYINEFLNTISYEIDEANLYFVALDVIFKGGQRSLYENI